MGLQEMLVEVYEACDNKIITQEDADVLIDGIYEQCIDEFMLECELEYIDEIFGPSFTESDHDINYTYLKAHYYDLMESGEIRQEFGEFLIDVITEAENDHSMHMMKKSIAAGRMGKKPSDLPNKKYAKDKNGELKNPEKSRKADLKYQYQQKLDKGGRSGSGTHRFTANTWNHDNFITSTRDSKSTIKMLEYLQKKGKEGDEDSIRKYKQVFRMFCTKYNIDEESSLYIAYNPGKVFKGVMGVSEWKQGQARNAETNKSDTGHALPSGYWLMHQSPADGIKELNPTRVSNHFLKQGKSGVNGQYRKDGRCYFTLQKGTGKKEEIVNSTHNLTSKITGKLGKHIYKLNENIREFFVDSENINSKGLDKVPIEQLVGKSVYVKTDKPLKVTQLQ